MITFSTDMLEGASEQKAAPTGNYNYLFFRENTFQKIYLFILFY